MTATDPTDTRSGHVPESLVYGPVQSRRFGLSLGVSFSAPGQTVCRWRCPYCQLGDWPYDESAPWPPAETIIEQCRAALEANSERPMVITVAGGGEPSDHPDFAKISHALRHLADEHQVRLLLLTNADGLDDACKRQALSAYHDYHVKWDPGPTAGSWRPGHSSTSQRIALVSALPDLHLQSMLYNDARGGNYDSRHISVFCADICRLKPEAVHLGTIDRDPRLSRYTAVGKSVLEAFAKTVHEATGIMTIVH